MLKLLEVLDKKSQLMTSITFGKYESRRFRTTGPGGSAVKDVLPVGGAYIDY